MQVPSRRRTLILFGVTALLTACASGPGASGKFGSSPARPIEYLDDRNGATVSAMGKPLLFASDRSNLAANLRSANLRDYVTITAASVNRAGKRDYVLIA